MYIVHVIQCCFYFSLTLNIEIYYIISEYVDNLLVVPSNGQVQGSVSISDPEAEVNSLILEESDNVHISLICRHHDGRGLATSSLLVQISSGHSQRFECFQILIL